MTRFDLTGIYHEKHEHDDETSSASSDSSVSLVSESSMAKFRGSSVANLSVSQSAAVLGSGLSRSVSSFGIVLLGQLVALVLAIRGKLTSTNSLECDLSTPSFQITLTYGLLALHLIYAVARERKEKIEESMLEQDIEHIIAHITGEDMRHFMGTPRSKTNNSGVSKGAETRRLKSGAADVQHATLLYTCPCANFTLRKPWWFYVLVAFLDVEANVLTNLALRYTSFSSASLMNCLTLPSAMFASRLLLNRRYKCIHLLGATVCLIGALVALISDYERFNEEHGAAGERSGNGNSVYPNEYLGDVLACMGAMLYGIVDTLSEMALKTSGQDEFLGMLGSFGFLIGAMQVAVLEREEVAQMFTGASSCQAGLVATFYAGIVGSFYIFYICKSRFLTSSEASLFNLSIMTSHAWIVMLSLLEEGKTPRMRLYTSMVVILSGIFIYKTAPSPVIDSNEETSTQNMNQNVLDLPESFNIT